MGHGAWGEILKAWGLDFRRTREDLALAGSPERCLLRTGVETARGELYLLERIAPAQLARRTGMAAVLQTLRARGLGPIQTYLADRRGGCVSSVGGEFWQLSPYIAGVPLDRPDYISDGWRGLRLAAFLVDLRGASRPALPSVEPEPFSIVRFIGDLRAKLSLHDPAVLEQTGAVMAFLQRDFAEAHESLPMVFSHGDLHPLNVVWSTGGIACVIDWEFMGMKPDLYDAANLIGCVGMENPRALTAPLVRAFLSGLHQADFLSPASRRYLVEAVIALRFAWLSEWLRKGDRQMVDLEIVYLNLLMENIDFLRNEWNRGGS